jgi:cell division protein FtsQ
LGRFTLVRARREAVAPSVRRFYRVRRFSGRVVPGRVVAWAVVGLVLIGAALWILYGTSVLGVREISVRGATIVTDDDVRAAAAVTVGTPLARVDTGAVAARVRTLAPVASVDVSRSWPGTLVVDVTERVPVAAVTVPTGFALLDATGVAFETVPAVPGGVVALKVAAPGPTDPATVAALKVLVALTPPLRSQLAAISAPSPTAIRLELTGGRTVIWGSAEQTDVKVQVATALLGRPGKTIDVSAPEVATTS